LTAWTMACAWCLACGERGKSAEGTAVPSPLVLHAVHWRMKSDSAVEITRDAFERAAMNGLRTVVVQRLGVERAVLNGELEIQDGSGVLVLDARIQTNILNFPIETTLMATSAVNSRGEADNLVDKGVLDLASALKELVRVAEAGKKAWAQGLHSSEMDVQLLSVRLLGRAKEKSAVVSLAALLSDPRERVAEAAAEALVEIGDSRAVSSIIKSIKRWDLRSEVRAIETIGRIGGEEAEAYLEMTAVGHEIEEVRRLSGDLLKALRKGRSR